MRFALKVALQAKATELLYQRLLGGRRNHCMAFLSPLTQLHPHFQKCQPILSCLLMWSKLFPHLCLQKTTWAVSSILVLCVAVLALQIAIDTKLSFINLPMPKCGHLLLQGSTFPDLPCAFPWIGQ